MEENNLKIGEFFGSLFGKIVNLVMVLITVGLVVLLGWFWHRNEMLKGDVENLQEKFDELEEMLNKSNDRVEDVEDELITNLNWIQELIEKEESQSVANPPASISKCTYKDEVVYYVPPRCCDISSALYNIQGKIICHPDGGYTGTGDGKCKDFIKERDACEIIWKDERINSDIKIPKTESEAIEFAKEYLIKEKYFTTVDSLKKYDVNVIESDGSWVVDFDNSQNSKEDYFGILIMKNGETSLFHGE